MGIKSLRELQERSFIIQNKENSYHNNIVEYLQYLTDSAKKHYEYLQYITNMTKESEFDEENGSNFEKYCNDLGDTMNKSVSSSERVAQELDYLFSKEVKRDTKINNILKNK